MQVNKYNFYFYFCKILVVEIKLVRGNMLKACIDIAQSSELGALDNPMSLGDRR